MTAYAKGAERERQLVKLLRSQGWRAWRVAGSRTPVDVVAMHPTHGTRLIQVKSGSGSPWSSFGPAGRAALLEEAEGVGTPVLVLWRPRRQPLWIFRSAWPEYEPPKMVTID